MKNRLLLSYKGIVAIIIFVSSLLTGITNTYAAQSTVYSPPGMFYTGEVWATTTIAKTDFSPGENIAVAGSLYWYSLPPGIGAGSGLTRQVGVSIVPQGGTTFWGSVIANTNYAPSSASGSIDLPAPLTPGTYELVPWIGSASLIIIAQGPRIQITVTEPPVVPSVELHFE